MAFFISSIAVSASAQGSDGTRKNIINTVIKDTQEAGTSKLPLSTKAKNLIGDAAKSSERTKDRSSHDSNMLFSSDCRNWNKAESLSEEILDSQHVYTRSEDGSLSLVNESQQTVLSVDKKVAFSQILEGKILFLIGKRGVGFRTVKDSKIHLGTLGIIQSVAILAAEATSQWIYNISKSGAPRLLYILDSPIKDSGYSAVICSEKNKGCSLTGKNGVKDIEVGTVEHKNLKDAKIFDLEKLNMWKEFCQTVSSTRLQNYYRRQIKLVKDSCSVGKVVEPNFKTHRNACHRLVSKLLPKVAEFSQ